MVCSRGGAGVQVAGREAGLTTGGDTQLDTPDTGEAEWQEGRGKQTQLVNFNKQH